MTSTRILAGAQAQSRFTLFLREPRLRSFTESFWYRGARRCLVCEHLLRQRVAKRRSFIGYPALGHAWCAYAHTHTADSRHNTSWLAHIARVAARIQRAGSHSLCTPAYPYTLMHRQQRMHRCVQPRFRVSDRAHAHVAQPLCYDSIVLVQTHDAGLPFHRQRETMRNLRTI